LRFICRKEAKSPDSCRSILLRQVSR